VVQADRRLGVFMPYEREPLLVEPGDRTTIRLDRCATITFERRRFDVVGDRIVVIDSKDAQMRCWMPSTEEGSPFRYSSDAYCLPIERDRSPTFDVGVSAAWIGVYSSVGLVARVPVELKPGGLQMVVWR
jgi:hypothetical protein